MQRRARAAPLDVQPGHLRCAVGVEVAMPTERRWTPMRKQVIINVTMPPQPAIIGASPRSCFT